MVRLANNKRERIWKEAVMPSFEVLNQQLPGGGKENLKNTTFLSLGRLYPERRSNRRPTKYKSASVDQVDGAA